MRAALDKRVGIGWLRPEFYLALARRLNGAGDGLTPGVGWLDLHLLASALASRATLATRDGRLARVTEALGVAAD